MRSNTSRQSNAIAAPDPAAAPTSVVVEAEAKAPRADAVFALVISTTEVVPAEPSTATKGVTLRDSASQGEQREGESAPSRNLDPKSKGKAVVEERNMKRDVMKQILVALQQPILVVEPSFTADDRYQLYQGETAIEAGPSDAAVAVVSATKAEAEAEGEATVADDSPTSCAAPVVEDVDAARAEARDNDPTVTSATDAGDLDDEDSDDEEDDESPDLPNTGKDLDDENDDDDNITIEYQRPVGATKGISLRDSASQGEQGVKEAAPEANQGPKSK
ncbi:uncharacterized protein LOC112504489 [Cynara cardunculus var. scolymus]|uniref:uncharacterized protein LOC112504489 n=1 Tax=Cynara cardunculus var. scolymus TaxID=59895 RepID=UPI000D630654|nr:uncharacterized protein LOC112504489 [Cynara cardunculus var. scolymus]